MVSLVLPMVEVAILTVSVASPNGKAMGLSRFLTLEEKPVGAEGLARAKRGRVDSRGCG